MMVLRVFLITVILWFMAVILVASCTHESYANTVQHKAVGLALTGYQDNIGAQPTITSGFFVRNISMRSHISMAKLERDTFTCAGFLCHQSVNPFQLCHLYLTVNGKASIKTIGAHTHA